MQEQGWRIALLKAADIIEQGGLCKGHLALGTARCVHGALNEVFFGQADCLDWIHGNLPDSYKQATTALAKVPGVESRYNNTSPWGYNLAGWNNAFERTAEEVVVAFRKAAMIELVEVPA